MKLTDMKGVGAKTEELFHKIGIYTPWDLLNYYPRDYDIYKAPSLIKDIDSMSAAAIEGEIIKSPELYRAGRLQILSVYIRDNNGDTIKATWFNMPFLKGRLKAGSRFIIRGRLGKKGVAGNNMGAALVLEHPEIFESYEYAEKMNRIQPIYALTKGLSNKLVFKAVKQILEKGASNCFMEEFLPKAMLDEYELADIAYAYDNIHFPNTNQDMYTARKRLAFNEFFLFIYELRRLRENTNSIDSHYYIEAAEEANRVLESLPYKLTNAQRNVLKEIRMDLTGDKMMNRLIQGDVGSGKTIVAILALIDTVCSGYQGAIMVPTEILAVQHYQTITELFHTYGIRIKTVLLTGSMSAKDKREVYALIASGEADIVIGTHALIQQKVEYHRLALVVTDEQHRFGVRQREALSMKGLEPHVIVMSATPIPRTLAIILYGDLDISVIDELPANRLPIKNCVVNTDYRPKAYRFIEEQLKMGRQAYVICPMILDSEGIEAENVIDYARTIKEALPAEFIVEYLHGKMRASEKNGIMERFNENEIQVLVSTTVIEVGVNVTNATVMLVENAERFGLSALHQLRGRVGRGNEQSYCIFISGSDKEETMERLRILQQSNDGFAIASEDLKLRGPGDFFGQRQSGAMSFKIGDIYADAMLIKNALKAVDDYDAGKYSVSKREQEMLKFRLQLTKEQLVL